MPFYMVTMKNPGRAPRYHEKEIGPCSTSPNCTDSEGAHHTFLAKTDRIDTIFADALKDGMHITRVEELYYVREYGATDVSVRDDADNPIGSNRADQSRTEFDVSIPGFESIPHVVSGERIYYSSDPHTSHFGDQFKLGDIIGLGDVSSGGAGEVPGADGEGHEDNPFGPKEKDYRIGPDSEGVIRNY